MSWVDDLFWAEVGKIIIEKVEKQGKEEGE